MAIYDKIESYHKFNWTTSDASTSLTSELESFVGQKYTPSNLSKIKSHISSYVMHETSCSSDAKYVTGDTAAGTGWYDINSTYDSCNGTLELNTSYQCYTNKSLSIKYCSDGYISINDESTKLHEMKNRIRNNLVIHVKSRAQKLSNIPANEQIAMDTLREMISETEFRKYLKYGFVLVPGKSGNVYQVFRNDSHTRVWRGGKVIEEICVRISYGVKAPTTDNVIAFKTMIEADEKEFKKIGNVYKMEAA